MLLSLLAAAARQAYGQELPPTPSDDELDAALVAHHPKVLDERLAEGLMVWFIVDRDSKVTETGIDDSKGLEDRLRAQNPDIGFALLFDHITINGRVVPILWMMPPPTATWSLPSHSSGHLASHT